MFQKRARKRCRRRFPRDKRSIRLLFPGFLLLSSVSRALPRSHRLGRRELDRSLLFLHRLSSRGTHGYRPSTRWTNTITTTAVGISYNNILTSLNRDTARVTDVFVCLYVLSLDNDSDVRLFIRYTFLLSIVVSSRFLVLDGYWGAREVW